MTTKDKKFVIIESGNSETADAKPDTEQEVKDFASKSSRKSNYDDDKFNITTLKIITDPKESEGNLKLKGVLGFIELVPVAEEVYLKDDGNLAIGVVEELKSITYPVIKKVRVTSLSLEEEEDGDYYRVNGDFRIKVSGSSETTKITKHPFTNMKEAEKYCLRINEHQQERACFIIETAEKVKSFFDQQKEAKAFV